MTSLAFSLPFSILALPSLLLVVVVMLLLAKEKSRAVFGSFLVRAVGADVDGGGDSVACFLNRAWLWSSTFLMIEFKKRLFGL